MQFQTFDREYVRRLTEGDPYVEDHFSKYFTELLLLKLRGRLRSPQLIQDVLQETLLRVLQTLRLKAGLEHPERLGAFVNSVCNNVMLEQLRSEGRHGQISEKTPDIADLRIDLDAPLINQQRKNQIQLILSELSEKDRELLRLLYLEEKDKSEVCRQFNVDSNYLRVLLHRAKSRFRETMIKHKLAAI